MSQKLPLIKKPADVGETEFQFFGVQETILQGWDADARRQIYLFRSKDDEHRWGYFDKDSERFMFIEQWNGKKALVRGRWISMTKYQRIHVNFIYEVTYKAWESGKEVERKTNEAIVNITDTAYQTLLEAMSGRPKNSSYRFQFKEKKGNSGMMKYVEKIVWHEELETV